MDEHQSLPYLYFDVAHAIRHHDWIIEHSGGLAGTKNAGLLESTLGHLQNDDYYPEMPHKLTYLVYSISKNHPFNDGNKRSAIGLASYFLELNGYDYVVKRFVLEMENIVVYVAMNAIDRDLLFRVIESLLYEDDYPEALKYDLVEAIAGYIGFTAEDSP